jgi:uncharacterized alkaline shock family protein YloU
MKPILKELQLLDTIYEQEVEIKAFKAIVLKTLIEIEGVYFLEENLIDSILGREGVEGVRGIEVKQLDGQPSLDICIRICLASGLSIPTKVEQVQTQVVKALTHDTGLHINRVQVIVENIHLPKGWMEKLQDRLVSALKMDQA